MKGAALNNWQAVQDEVVRRIHAQVWKQGDLIPNEADLAKEFGCARATVNRALQGLADTGLLDRRRKAGTRVSPFPTRKATLHIPVIRREIEATGQTHSYRLAASQYKPPPSAVVAQMGLRSGSLALHVVGVHSGDGRPYVIEDRWINPAEVPHAQSVDFAAQSPNEWLVANVPFNGGDISFSAKAASASQARLLQCERGASLFVIDRTTRRNDRAITSVRLVFSPGYSIQTEI